jgi:hypothetical protein
MEQTTTTAVEAKRPTFLTVLCILSFIAAGISVVVSFLGFAAMQAAESMMGGMSDSMGEMAALPGMEEAAALWKYAQVLLIIGVGCTILGLIGVIMMWKLKKTGFYLYTAAQIIGIIIPVVLVGTAGLSYVGIFFALAFIVMYGLNLKHMTK